jgi:DNA-binding response OmpR family regulator
MTTVLIADDSIAVRKVAERLLTEAGFGVTLAANGEEALAYLAKETPDMVVSDVIMPDRSGYEVCTFVRAQRALANTPVLLISGIVNDEVTKQAESCHADGVLKKPFQGTSLKDRVIELLAKRQRTAMPVAMTVEKVVAPIEPNHGSSGSGDELETRRQAVTQVKSLEEELRIERGRVAYSAQRVVQLEEQLDSVKELESMLAREREQTAQLKKQVAELDSATVRVQELESLLKIERAQTVEAKMQASVAESLDGRVRELEAALQAERQAAKQLVEQMTEMEETATRYQQVSQQLVQEEERTRDLTHRVAASEQLAVRAGSLEEALADERKKTNSLATRISKTEPASQKAHEFEALLQMERERNSLLAKRMTETEQEAELATKRFEEMARKLGEIAGLASQLGSGKRRP